MNDTKFMKKIFYLSQYTKITVLKVCTTSQYQSMSASASVSSSTSKIAGWAASWSSSVGSASLNGSSLISSSWCFSKSLPLLHGSPFWHGTRISPRTKTVWLQISPRVNDWGLIRTGGLFQNLGLYGAIFDGA